MAGTIKLDGTTFLSKSGSDFTLDVGSGGTISQGTFKGSLSEVPNVYQTTIIKRTSNGLDITGTTETASSSETFVNKKASSTCYVEVFGQSQAGGNGSGSTSIRYATLSLYHKSSAVSQGATSDFGTLISRRLVGRSTGETTTNTLAGYWPMVQFGVFTAGSAGSNNYLHLTADADGGSTRTELFCSATYPIYFRITEVA